LLDVRLEQQAPCWGREERVLKRDPAKNFFDTFIRDKAFDTIRYISHALCHELLAAFVASCELFPFQRLTADRPDPFAMIKDE